MLLSSRFFVALLMACSIPLAAISQAWSQTAESPPQSPEEQPETIDELVNRTCSFLSDQKSFTVEMDVTYDDVLDSGAKVQYSAYQKVWVTKPNQLRSDYTGDERNTRFYYDGKSFTLLTTDLGLYATKATAASNIDQLIDNIEEKFGFSLPLANLFVRDPCPVFTTNVQSTVFVGNNMVNRTPAYQVLFTGENRDYQVWFSQDETPLVMKVVITYKTLPGAPQYKAVLSKWNFNPQITADEFTFVPPEGASKIEFLTQEDVAGSAIQLMQPTETTETESAQPAEVIPPVQPVETTAPIQPSETKEPIEALGYRPQAIGK